MISWTDSQMSGSNRRTHWEDAAPSPTDPPPPSADMWATSWWLNQANSAVQDGRGRKGMEEGSNEPWLLSWYELCPRDSPKQWTLTAHVEILPQTVLWVWERVCVCGWESEKRANSDLAAETRWSKPQKESVAQCMEQEGPRICVTTHRKCPVMLRGCVRAVGVSGAGEDGTKACSSLQRIYLITPYEWNPLPPHLEARKGLFHWPTFITVSRSMRCSR